MKVLVVTAHDAVNLSVENVVREFVRRGHEIGVFANRMEPRHIRMFDDLNVPIQPISALTAEEVKKYDCAFCPMDSVPSLTFHDIYIFTYNFIFSNRWATPAGDFMFVQTEKRPIFCWEDCARMAVGSPKNDTVVSEVSTSNRILYIDTGHYPFGLEGKTQLGQTLISMCSKFPGYDFVVKPRWLPNEVNNIHVNKIHLYDVITKLCDGQLPNNLQLLYEYRDMQELIDECITVITPGSSAYLDAALRGKGLLILGGLASENSYDLRTDTVWKLLFSDMEASGCLVDFKDAEKFLPHGLKCREEHLDRIVAYRGNVSQKIVEVAEYICTEFLCKNKFPAIKQYDLRTYKEAIQQDPSVNYTTLKQRRMKNQVLVLSRRFDWVAASIDYGKWFSILDSCYQDYPATPSALKELNTKMLRELDKLWYEYKAELSQDPIDQSNLLQSMFQLGHHNEILQFSSEEILCIGPYHYYLGKIYQKQKMPEAAINSLCLFLKEANSRTYIKYPQEVVWGIRNAYDYLLNVYDGKNIPIEVFADLYCALYEQRDPMVVAYNRRKRAHNFLPKVAEQFKDINPEQALKCLRLYAKYEYHYNIRERNERIGVLEREIASLRGSKVYRSAQAVTWPFRKLKGGIKCWRENGFKYTINRLRQKAGSWISAKAPAIHRIWGVFSKKVLGGYALYKGMMEKYGENAQILLSSAALGDNYLLGRCVGAYMSKKYPDRTPVFCVYGKQGVDIANLFGIGHSEPFNMADYQILINLFMFIDNKLIHLDLMHHHIGYRHTAILMHVEGLHGFNLSTIGMAYLDVEEAELQSPKFVYEDNFIFDLFSMHSLPAGKTVLLSPYAKSVKQIPVRFWERLAAELLKKGYHVCTNSAGEFELTIKNTLPLLIPLQYAVPFIERAGIYIGLRSGLSDVLSSAKAVKIVLHPRANFKRGLVRDINYSYSMIGMYHQPNQYELIYSNENENELLHDIMQTVGQTNGH